MARRALRTTLALLTFALAACGAIRSDEPVLPSPLSAAADPALCAGGTTAGPVVFKVVGDQCLRSFAAMAVSRPAGESGRRTLAAVPIRTVDAIALMDWAETAYPQFFPGHAPDQTEGPYLYRHYAPSGNYVGVANDSVYVLGPVSGGALLYVGSLAEFRCSVYPDNCIAAVEVQPASVTIAPSGVRQFSATVTGTDNMAVMWSLSGTGCSGAACGTISSSGLYRAPASMPTPAQVTVRATLTSDASKWGSANVEVRSSSSARLKGEFAFVYQGVWNGHQGHCSGRFVADGAGNLSAGITDCTSPNYPGGLVLGLPFTGSFSVFEDGRGEMAWTLPSGGVVTFRFALTANGERGLLQTFYSPSVIHAGEFRKQDATALNAAAINGDYVFTLVGAGDLERGAAAIGRFHANGAGQITAGAIDINNGAAVRQNLSFTGIYSVAADGRGSARFDIPSLGELDFALQVVGRNRLILSSIDVPAPGILTLAGEALARTGAPFTARSLRGTGVFQLRGRASAFSPTVTIGLLASDGVAKITGVLDQNSGGAIAAGAPFAASYAITADGRGTIGAAAAPAYILQIVGPNHAVLMNAQPLTDPVLAGTLEPQRPGPFTGTSLLGHYASATVAPPIAASVSVTAITRVDPTGLMTVPQDWTSPVGLTADVTGQGTFSMAVNGRAVVNPAAGGSAVVYVISPTRFVEILTGVPALPPEDKTLLFIAEQ